LAKALKGKVTKSLPVIDLTPIRFQTAQLSFDESKHPRSKDGKFSHTESISPSELEGRPNYALSELIDSGHISKKDDLNPIRTATEFGKKELLKHHQVPVRDIANRYGRQLFSGGTMFKAPMKFGSEVKIGEVKDGRSLGMKEPFHGKNYMVVSETSIGSHENIGGKPASYVVRVKP